MVRGVAAVAQRDQVPRIIGATRGSWNQVMDVSFAQFTCLTARPTNMAVASKNDFPDITPALVMLTRMVGR